ncbi:nucleolar protein 4-like isoform X2 [Tubulanus polymorphus]|uniref:nucleolar protein 4-like isoform X2 n=1 Tax=Tubulanus polymorphus TaxID=672921 RepID=UPI003DA326A9
MCVPICHVDFDYKACHDGSVSVEVDIDYRYMLIENDSMSSAESEASVDHASPAVAEEEQIDIKETGESLSAENSRTPTPVEEQDTNDVKNAVKDEEVSKEEKENTDTEQNGKGHPERKRRASDELSLDSSTKASDALDDTKDEDDNDDDDEDDLKITSQYDPERLKSFNMFVRLFVDENLDRIVPISKQPKDKVQAILEACNRQFPEFQERARKRIRTYLKSCRRMRRSKDANGLEQLRPTPPHLTSAAAESILAQACENESQNAKRMRMGLEPLAVSVDSVTRKPPSLVAGAQEQTHALPPSSPASASTQQNLNTSTSQQTSQTTVQPAAEKQTTSEFARHAPPTAFRPPHELAQAFTFANGNGLFRPGFPAFQHPAHNHPLLQQSALTSQVPNDLTVKKGAGSGKNTLNPQEVATIKQLIAGYRESAAFLYRSADELEQLLLQQN